MSQMNYNYRCTGVPGFVPKSVQLPNSDFCLFLSVIYLLIFVDYSAVFIKGLCKIKNTCFASIFMTWCFCTCIVNNPIRVGH